ncbi:hypothetical protein AAVH_27065 [Aphelenchoides avenae]|nr:hypothetical protein AAVH_27065 [Aphelenchus avenae]
MVLGWLFGYRDAGPTAEEIVRRLEETRIERELALREAIVERKNAFKASFGRYHEVVARKILIIRKWSAV